MFMCYNIESKNNILKNKLNTMDIRWKIAIIATIVIIVVLTAINRWLKKTTAMSQYRLNCERLVQYIRRNGNKFGLVDFKKMVYQIDGIVEEKYTETYKYVISLELEYRIEIVISVIDTKKRPGETIFPSYYKLESCAMYKNKKFFALLENITETEPYISWIETSKKEKK